MANITVEMPTAKDLEEAHKRYQEEVCDHFAYRIATEEMLAGRLAEGIMLLLIVWSRLNRTKFHPKSLHDVLRENACIIAEFAGRSFSSMTNSDEIETKHLFRAFNDVPYIGPVGAAKSMHLLASDFFPLWDTAIAEQYHCSLDAEGYWTFMLATKRQYENLQPEWGLDVGLLKLLDEYNYCKYKLHII